MARLAATIESPGPTNFEISQKRLQKVQRNHSVLVFKKALQSEHRKNYILPDINYFVETAVSMLVRYQILLMSQLKN